MRAISQIRMALEARIQFIEQLTLLSSFDTLIDFNQSKMERNHLQLENKEIKTIKILLNTVRLDENFKKQTRHNFREYHKIIIRVFQKIEPTFSAYSHSNGKINDIIEDYSQFFNKMKQNNILNLLKGMIETKIYNQHTIVYVLIEILFKYFRVKTSNLLNSYNPKKSIEQPKKVYDFSKTIQKHQLTKQKPFFNVVQEKKRITTQKLHQTVSPKPRCHTICSNSIVMKKEKKATHRHNSKTDKLSNLLVVKQKKITNRSSSGLGVEPNGFSATMLSYYKDQIRYQTQTIMNQKQKSLSKLATSVVLTESKKKKRRVIKSYKCRKQTQSKINKINNLICTQSNRNYPSVNRQNYLRAFINSFNEQWEQYIKMTGLYDPCSQCLPKKQNPKKQSQSSKFISAKNQQQIFSPTMPPIKRNLSYKFSQIEQQKRKKQWSDHNIDRVVVQACYRNDSIRRQMESYNQQYNLYMRS